METTDCKNYREDLKAFADGELPEASRAAVEAHLKSCADCRAEVAFMERMAADFRAFEGAAERKLSAEFRGRLLARMEEAKPESKSTLPFWRRFPPIVWGSLGTAVAAAAAFLLFFRSNSYAPTLSAPAAGASAPTKEVAMKAAPAASAPAGAFGRSAPVAAAAPVAPAAPAVARARSAAERSDANPATVEERTARPSMGSFKGSASDRKADEDIGSATFNDISNGARGGAIGNAAGGVAVGKSATKAAPAPPMEQAEAKKPALSWNGGEIRVAVSDQTKAAQQVEQLTRENGGMTRRVGDNPPQYEIMISGDKAVLLQTAIRKLGDIPQRDQEKAKNGLSGSEARRYSSVGQFTVILEKK